MDKKNKVKDDEPTISFDQIADMLQQRDNYGVREVHPTTRSLSIIASRCNIIQQNIPDFRATIANIIHIPEGIKISCGLPNSSNECVNKDQKDDKQICQHQNNMKDNYMVIEILNDVILQGLPMTSVTSEHALQTQHNHNVENLSFKCIISKYKLDFKQSVAFEIMSCSFILKSLKVHNISDDTLHQFLKRMKINRINTQIA